MLFKQKNNDKVVEVNIGDLIRFRGRAIDHKVKGKIFLATKIEKVDNPQLGDYWEVLLICDQQKAWLYPEDGDELYEIVSRLE